MPVIAEDGVVRGPNPNNFIHLGGRTNDPVSISSPNGVRIVVNNVPVAEFTDGVLRVIGTADLVVGGGTLAAYTQTYSTADRVHANLTVGSDIAAFTDPPSAAEMAALRTFVNALKADLTDLKQLVNSVIDDLQTLGLVG